MRLPVAIVLCFVLGLGSACHHATAPLRSCSLSASGDYVFGTTIVSKPTCYASCPDDIEHLALALGRTVTYDTPCT